MMLIKSWLNLVQYLKPFHKLGFDITCYNDIIEIKNLDVKINYVT